MSGQPRRHSRSVHFAQNDTHILEGTPSPTLSSSTLSSPELSSPLGLPHLNLPNSPIPYVYQAWSPASPSTSQLHPSPPRPNAKVMSLDLDSHLQIPPTNQLPCFTFDLTRDPQGMGIKPALTKAVLDQPAVQPPVAKMPITIVSEAYQWVVEVRPGLPANADERPREYVTVKDVLYGIYNDLQGRLNEVDQQKMSLSVLEKAGLACQLRRARIKQLEKRDESAGLKRVDLLYKSHRFKGLAVDPRNGNWVLHVEEM
ncbi:hypothetical protein EST38_g4386 [Candolleomyces aberdarensis]|uniref:DUF6699 domain-containing protein n=1 Tax=Candolleomyces aberdarensis TaxID=2316362 RepID=A0A4Q2DMR0_9AGAR|nr:hypothetical protein EST38_g4386 [Candolleomyces aberdarensis]